MTQYTCHGIQCVFILNRSVMQPEKKKVSQKGALCSLLSFACQFLHRAACNTLVSNAMVEL